MPIHKALQQLFITLGKVSINITHAACIIVKYKFLSTRDKFYIHRKMKQLNKY